MASQLPLRTKLAFWYGTIVALTLSVYSIYTSFSVSRELHESLDVSLARVVSSLDYLLLKNQERIYQFKNRVVTRSIQDRFSLFRELEQMRFVGPIRPSVAHEKLVDEDIGGIWSAVYEHILLNPKNYFIQIADTNNQIIWRSPNLQNDTLPTLSGFTNFTSKDTIWVASYSNDSVLKLAMEKPKHLMLDSVLVNSKVLNTNIRLMVKRTPQAIISVGYATSDIQNTLNQLFLIQMVAFPFVLVISILGGWVMSSISLRPIDLIAKTADEITAKNLSRRLPEVPTKDEVGHLVRTLNRMIERLERAFIQIRKFTSDVSHELRTPLTILQGEMEIALHSRKTPEEYEDVLVSALEEVGRLTNVVESLLELSRAEMGQINMNFQDENISKIALDVVEDISIIAESKDIKIETKIESNVIVPIDAPRIHQALLNLLDNAVKYTPRGGYVTLSLQKNGEYVELVVEDNGIGIPKEEIPHIFDRMYRVDKARASNIQGAGLGLSIVKWIVESHHGTIDVQSEVNKFTRFIVNLPLNHPQENETYI